MQFLIHTDSIGKKTLYPNKTNAPPDILKEGVTEIDVPTDKEGLMSAFQELFDMVHEAQNSKQEVAEVQKEPKQQNLSLLLAENLEDIPLGARIDMVLMTLEDVRPMLLKMSNKNGDKD